MSRRPPGRRHRRTWTGREVGDIVTILLENNDVPTVVGIRLGVSGIGRTQTEADDLHGRRTWPRRHRARRTECRPPTWGTRSAPCPEGLPRAVPANASRQTRTPPAQLVEALGGGPKWGAQHMGVLENFAGNILCAECTALIDPAATHHPFGVWDYSTQVFYQARSLHHLRGQLGRQHSAHGDAHRWMMPRLDEASFGDDRQP